MLIGMLVGCMPQDNHTPLLLRTTRKQKKIKVQLWNPFSKIKLWPIDNSEENRALVLYNSPEESHFLPSLYTMRVFRTAPLLLGIYSTPESFWMTALVSGLCDLKPRVTVMSTIKYQYRNTNFWSGVWVNRVLLFGCMAKSINWSPLTSLLFNIIQEKSTVTHIGLTYTHWNTHLLEWESKLVASLTTAVMKEREREREEKRETKAKQPNSKTPNSHSTESNSECCFPN